MTVGRSQDLGRARDLEWLLKPLDPAVFARDHYEKKTCVVRRGDPRYHAGLLSLEDLDAVLGSHAARRPDVNVVQHGRDIKPTEYASAEHVVDPFRVAKLFAGGATVIFTRLDKRVPTLARFCSRLSATFSSRIQTNIYLTPAGAQGFAPHWDTHDVFVLQVAGSKQWTIYDAPLPLPLRGQEFDPEQHFPGEPTMEFTLHAGDLAYVPRGFFHSAVATDEMSLHITTGLIAFTWTDLLLHAVTAAGEADPVLRENLPMGFDTGGISASQRSELLRERLSRFVQHAQSGALFESLSAELLAHWEPCLTDLLSQIERSKRLTLGSTVRCRPDAAWAYREDDEACILQWHGNDIRFPKITSEALEFVQRSRRFRVAEIPDSLDEAGKLTLVRRLIQEGFLECLESGATSSAA